VKRQSTVALLIIQMGYLPGCETLRRQEAPLRASLVTDSSGVAAYFSGNAYIATIGFTFTNTTGRGISRAGCGGPGWPGLEKQVNGRWVPAYYPVSMMCRTIPDFFWEPGAQVHDVLQFRAFERGHHTMPEIMVDSIDGVYRLHWGFTEGRDAHAKGARRVDAISNEFRLTLHPGPAPASNTR
jgi:hypothetical protein